MHRLSDCCGNRARVIATAQREADAFWLGPSQWGGTAGTGAAVQVLLVGGRAVATARGGAGRARGRLVAAAIDLARIADCGEKW
jgi:hypothetical protein